MNTIISFGRFLWSGNVDPNFTHEKVSATRSRDIEQIAQITFKRKNYSFMDVVQLKEIQNDTGRKITSSPQTITITVDDQVIVEIPNLEQSRKQCSIFSRALFALMVSCGMGTLVCTALTINSLFKRNMKGTIHCGLAVLPALFTLLFLRYRKAQVDHFYDKTKNLNASKLEDFANEIYKSRASFFRDFSKTWNGLAKNIVFDVSEIRVLKLDQMFTEMKENKGSLREIFEQILDMDRLSLENPLVPELQEILVYLIGISSSTWAVEVLQAFSKAALSLQLPRAGTFQERLRIIQESFSISDCLAKIEKEPAKKAQKAILGYLEGRANENKEARLLSEKVDIETAENAIGSEEATTTANTTQEASSKGVLAHYEKYKQVNQGIKKALIEQITKIVNEFKIPVQKIPDNDPFWTLVGVTKEQWIRSSKK